MLRPEPGASATVARARALGAEAVAAPIFVVRPVDWTPPDEPVDAVMMTSANAVRHGGAALARYRHLPLHAVGEATAAAARAAGFADVRVGPGDAASLVAGLTGRVLHLAGRDHRPALAPGGVRRVVYASEGIPALPRAAAAQADRAVSLLHSARAARHFAALLDGAGIDRAAVRVAALSPAVAGAVTGWRSAAVAAEPDDAALIAAGLAVSGATL